MAEQTAEGKPVLPEQGKANVLITSALPYVNNVPHLGNLIGSVLSADVFARYCRGRGAITLFVCGTDEYGTTSEARALVENVTPQELCDKYHTLHAENDNSTSDRDHAGYTPQGSSERFLMFLELDKLQPEISEFVQQSASVGSWSTNGKDITSAWLKEGLKPRSITRDIKWGTAVPLPGYEAKTIYSWFDACIGYVSITAAYTDAWERWWRNPDPETRDSEFNWGSFISSNNNVLLKNLGNFVSRVVKFINSKHFSGIVPNYLEYSNPKFETWKDEINDLLSKYIESLDAVRLRAALAIVMHISQKVNDFIQSNGLDNKLAENEPAKCAAVVGLGLNLIHLLASISAPYMPDAARSMNAQLNMDPSSIPDRWTADSIKPGHQLGEASFLFSPIKAEKEKEWRDLLGSD